MSGQVRPWAASLVLVGAPPKVLILAGPNGAGKTTFAREFLVHEAACPRFFNADLIAEGLSPFAPERAAVRAGRIMLGLIDDAVGRRESFAFETNLAGRNFARAIPRWREAGYVVTLIFLSLPSAELAVSRVAERTRHGGHAVPEATIRRRFTAGLENLHGVYKGIVDAWALFDTGGSRPVLVSSGSEATRAPTNAGMEDDHRAASEAATMAALLRARRRAEAIARRTGTQLVQMVDGGIVRVDPVAVGEDAEGLGEGFGV